MKQKYNPLMFQCSESLDMSKYIVATYYMRGKGNNPMELDLAKFAESIAQNKQQVHGLMFLLKQMTLLKDMLQKLLVFMKHLLMTENFLTEYNTEI